ncbi:MAG: class I mannose-6-phosphate isomerase [Bacteroidota bacterium]|nr:class I mannose-6-phosphate isomerase [Bacteroidota bacterium]MDP4195141.1 class I mannose-6-phosphate isomerase [Bacteroidota bacterium]
MNTSFNKYPFVSVKGYEHSCKAGWTNILLELSLALNNISKSKKIITIECYTGVYESKLLEAISENLKPALTILSKDAFKSEMEIRQIVSKDLSDDPVFGKLTSLTFDDYFDKEKFQALRRKILNVQEGIILVLGTGASLLAEDSDILIYADMPRWEIQQRFRKNLAGNLGVCNNSDQPALKYKWAFFIDWRLCDTLKKNVFLKADYFLDTTLSEVPKILDAEALKDALHQTSKGPFSVVPFFDPGPWGGQWMKKVCDLDKNVPNFAWCFNCVPEENSLLLKFGNELFETPSINLVFFKPKELLGDFIYNKFGAEFPIRFDYLDTIDGGNLSLQVHPLTEYIKEKFNWPYTQDESYYIMDAKPGASVYLGLKDNINKDSMRAALLRAEKGKNEFQADKYVEKWQAKKHDHFLIPAGTVHCSGKDSLVLEISSTPYIFTFKLWDWARNGLDGKPRPTHIEHGLNVIQFNRTAKWTKENLINRFVTLSESSGCKEEKTGLHELEFIETRRHTFSNKVLHNTHGTVNVLTLVDGAEAIVESPDLFFEPFIVRYGETFIVPASVGEYTISPYGISEGKICMTMKAFVRE